MSVTEPMPTVSPLQDDEKDGIPSLNHVARNIDPTVDRGLPPELFVTVEKIRSIDTPMRAIQRPQKSAHIRTDFQVARILAGAGSGKSHQVYARGILQETSSTEGTSPKDGSSPEITRKKARQPRTSDLLVGLGAAALIVVLVLVSARWGDSIGSLELALGLVPAVAMVLVVAYEAWRRALR